MLLYFFKDNSMCMGVVFIHLCITVCSALGTGITDGYKPRHGHCEWNLAPLGVASALNLLKHLTLLNFKDQNSILFKNY